MILVAGATGLVGGMIARGVLEQGRDTRIHVRPGSTYQALMAAGAQPILGDLKDPSSLVAVCAGVETVITSASAGQRGGGDTPETVDLEGNRHLIDAARMASVSQFVFISTIGADEVVRRTVTAALTRFRTSAGGYRQRNTFRSIIAAS
jgi:NADH dehydrogenase